VVGHLGQSCQHVRRFANAQPPHFARRVPVRAAVAARASALTREAIERKVFGAPFSIWQGEPFWGQDRLDLLEAALTAGRPALAYRDA